MIKKVKLNKDSPEQEEEKKEIKIKFGEAHTRKFQDEWSDKFFWLKYNKDQNIMVCELCLKHGKQNVFTKGFTRFKIDALYEHTIIKDHIQSYEDSITKRTLDKMMQKFTN